MKKHAFTFTLMALTTLTQAQSFIKKAGTPETDQLKKSIALGDSYYFAGNTYSSGTSHIQTIKTDSSGNHVWNIITQGSVNDHVADLIALNNTAILTAGTIRKIVSSSNLSDGYLQLQEPSGTILWKKQYSVYSHETFITSAINTNDGGIAVLGGYYDSSNNLLPFLGKLDSTGMVQWCKSYSSPTYFNPGNLIQLSNDEYIIGGSVSLGFMMIDACVFKVDATGFPQWSKIINFDGLYEQNSSYIKAIELPNTDIMLCGYSDYGSFGSIDFMVTKITPAGSILNNIYFGTTQMDWLYDASFNPVSNRILLHGDSGGFGNPSQMDGLIVAIDTTSSVLNSWVIGDTSGTYMYERVSTAFETSGGIIGAGHLYDLMASQDDYYYFKIPSADSSCIQYKPKTGATYNTPVVQSFTTTGTNVTLNASVSLIEHISSFASTELCFIGTSSMEEHYDQQNVTIFPNPTSSILTISAQEKRISAVGIYNITGQLVYSVTNISNHIQCNLQGLNKGTYAVAVQFEDGSMISKKLILSE